LSNNPTAYVVSGFSRTVIWPKWTLVASGALLMTACASAGRRPVAAVPGGDLPPGQGRTILQAACTVCHDLREVTKFRSYYNKQQWQDIVATMIGYGANLKKEDADVLVAYLTQNLGRK
jgi:cytochrome c5